MIIQVDLEAHPPRVTLEAPEDFKGFKVLATGEGAALADAVAPLGRLEGDDHAFVQPEALIELAGPLADDPDWRERFGAMVAYARGKGWTDASGAIRAHIER